MLQATIWRTTLDRSRTSRPAALTVPPITLPSTEVVVLDARCVDHLESLSPLSQIIWKVPVCHTLCHLQPYNTVPYLLDPSDIHAQPVTPSSKFDSRWGCGVRCCETQWSSRCSLCFPLVFTRCVTECVNAVFTSTKNGLGWTLHFRFILTKSLIYGRFKVGDTAVKFLSGMVH